MSDYTKRNAELLNSINNVTPINDPLYVPVQDSAQCFEINYEYNATKWLMIRPNLHYIKNPGGVKKTDDSLAGGMQFILTF